MCHSPGLARPGLSRFPEIRVPCRRRGDDHHHHHHKNKRSSPTYTNLEKCGISDRPTCSKCVAATGPKCVCQIHPLSDPKVCARESNRSPPRRRPIALRGGGRRLRIHRSSAAAPAHTRARARAEPCDRSKPHVFAGGIAYRARELVQPRRAARCPPLRKPSRIRTHNPFAMSRTRPPRSRLPTPHGVLPRVLVMAAALERPTWPTDVG